MIQRSDFLGYLRSFCPYDESLVRKKSSATGKTEMFAAFVFGGMFVAGLAWWLHRREGGNSVPSSMIGDNSSLPSCRQKKEVPRPVPGVVPGDCGLLPPPKEVPRLVPGVVPEDRGLLPPPYGSHIPLSQRSSSSGSNSYVMVPRDIELLDEGAAPGVVVGPQGYRTEFGTGYGVGAPSVVVSDSSGAVVPESSSAVVSGDGHGSVDT